MPRRGVLSTLSAEARTLAVPGVHARRGTNWSAAWLAAALLAPTLVFLLLFTYWPLVVSVMGSFQRFGRGGTAPRWVGWQNYWDLWNDALFHQVLVNTGIYALIAGPVAVAFGLGAAVAVDGHRRLRLVARTLIFHPVLLPTVAIAATWLFLLNPVSGPVATLITRLTGRAQGLL